MVAANCLNFLSQGTFAVLVLAGEPRLWQMMLLTALGGTGQAFFSPAAEGMLMSSVSGEQAGRAFAVFRIAMQGAALGGAALGGALVAAVGPGWVLAVDAAAFVFAVAGTLRAFLDVSHIPPRAPGEGMLADLREGWREVMGRPWLWGIVVQFSIANAVMTRWKPRRPLFVGTLCVFPLALPSAALAVPVPVGILYVVMLVSGTVVEVFGVSWMTVQHLGECHRVRWASPWFLSPTRSCPTGLGHTVRRRQRSRTEIAWPRHGQPPLGPATM